MLNLAVIELPMIILKRPHAAEPLQNLPMFDAAWFLLSNRLIGRMKVNAKIVGKPVLLRITVNIADQVNEMAL